MCSWCGALTLLSHLFESWPVSRVGFFSSVETYVVGDFLGPFTGLDCIFVLSKTCSKYVLPVKTVEEVRRSLFFFVTPARICNKY